MSQNHFTAAKAPLQPADRADEVQDVLNSVQSLLIPFIRSADQDSAWPLDAESSRTSNGNLYTKHRTTLVDHKQPEELQKILRLELPSSGQGKTGLVHAVEKILRYSVNTWHQGFLDKLYSSTNAPGLAAELVLATLNTNVHVFQVSPALTLVEKYTTKRLAALFGFNGPHAGGISVQGGSASNMTSIVVARNVLFPQTKTDGYGDHKFVLFTSAHGHYSIEKAAQTLGFGSKAAWCVPVDRSGRMIPSELERLVQKSKGEGKTPFYVNATAGTTVFGSFDPFDEIAEICRKHNLWFHIDGSWGGSFAFSRRQKQKLSGAEKANSIAINPHKMLGVPITCSFLLGADLRQFHKANTLPAGYLFHNNDPPSFNGDFAKADLSIDRPEVWDLADLTLQCGRRADSLKLFLSWTYYGSEGYERQIDAAWELAASFAALIDNDPDLILLSENPPPCLQVCFFYAPRKQLVFRENAISDPVVRGTMNSKITEGITQAIVNKGFMVDYAPPGKDEDPGTGKFFRCVVNLLTKKETVEALLRAIKDVGAELVEQMRQSQLRTVNGCRLDQSRCHTLVDNRQKTPCR